MEWTPEILIEGIVKILGALGIIGVGIKYLLDRKDRLHKEEIERKDKEHAQKLELLELQNTSNRINLSVLRNFQKMKFFSELEKFSKKIFNMLGAERFLILIAVNGTTRPNKVSVLYGNEVEEYQNDLTLEERYFETPIDDCYREMLYYVENNTFKLLKIEEMGDCYLKSFYIEEGIQTSLVFFLKRYSINDRDDAVIFCSIAVHKYVEWTFFKCTSAINLTRSKVISILDKIVK